MGQHWRTCGSPMLYSKCQKSTDAAACCICESPVPPRSTLWPSIAGMPEMPGPATGKKMPIVFAECRRAKHFLAPKPQNIKKRTHKRLHRVGGGVEGLNRARRGVGWESWVERCSLNRAYWPLWPRPGLWHLGEGCMKHASDKFVHAAHRFPTYPATNNRGRNVWPGRGLCSWSLVLFSFASVLFTCFIPILLLLVAATMATAAAMGWKTAQSAGWLTLWATCGF